MTMEWGTFENDPWNVAKLTVWHIYSHLKKTTPFNSSTNYRREIKLVRINMDYCLLQFDDLKFFFGVRLHGGWSLIFSMQTPKFDNEIIKFTSQIAWKQNFTTFLTLVSELLDAGIAAIARFLEESFFSSISFININLKHCN